MSGLVSDISAIRRNLRAVGIDTLVGIDSNTCHLRVHLQESSDIEYWMDATTDVDAEWNKENKSLVVWITTPMILRIQYNQTVDWMWDRILSYREKRHLTVKPELTQSCGEILLQCSMRESVEREDLQALQKLLDKMLPILCLESRELHFLVNEPFTFIPCPGKA